MTSMLGFIPNKDSDTSSRFLQLINHLHHLLFQHHLRELLIHVKQIIVIDGLMSVTTSFSDDERAESILHCIKRCKMLAIGQYQKISAALTSSPHTTTRRIPTQNSRITPPTRQQTTQTRPKKATRILLQNHHFIFRRLQSLRKLPERIPSIIAT